MERITCWGGGGGIAGLGVDSYLGGGGDCEGVVLVLVLVLLLIVLVPVPVARAWRDDAPAQSPCGRTRWR